VQQTHSL